MLTSTDIAYFRGIVEASFTDIASVYSRGSDSVGGILYTSTLLYSSPCRIQALPLQGELKERGDKVVYKSSYIIHFPCTVDLQPTYSIVIGGDTYLIEDVKDKNNYLLEVSCIVTKLGG